MSVPRGAVLGIALLSILPCGFAADATWTADATTGYLWDDAANWSTSAVPTAGDAVILPAVIPEAGAAANITLGAGEQAASVRFRNRYALLLGDLFVPALYADMGVTGTIGSRLTGSGGLTKTGGGAIRLTNAANDYTGLTTVTNGALIISSTGALGADTSTVTVSGSATRGFGGGALVLDGTTTGFTLSRNLALTGYGPIADRSAALISVGANTLSGSVAIAQGLANTRVTSAFGRLTFSGTTTASGTAGTHFSILGGTNQAGVGQYAITGPLAGTGTLEKSGSGMLLLAPSSSSGFSGNVRISTSSTGAQSSVRILSNGVLGTSTTATSGNNVLDFNGGILEVRMDNPVLTSGGAAANSYLRISSALFVDHAPGSAALNGTLVLGQQYFEDGQTLTLNGRNGYGFTFGAAPVNGGENNSTITNNLGGTLTYTGTFWSNGNGTSRTMTVGGNGNTVISGNVTASSTTAGVDHSLTKTGAGSLTITSTAATLDGNLNVNGGAVAITDFRSVNMHAATTTNNGQINIGTGTTAGNLIIGTATTPTAAGLTTSKTIDLAATTAATAIYANQPGTSPVILNGPITATGAGAKILTLAGTNTAGNIVNGIIANNTGTNTTSVTKFGPGTWILAGANTYTGTTLIAAGTLALQANATAATVLPAGSTITFGQANSYAGGTLELRGQASAANTFSVGTLNTGAQGANRLVLTPGTGGSVALTVGNVTTGGTSTLDIVGGGANATVAFTQINAAAGADGLLSRTIFWNGADYAYRTASTGAVRAIVYGSDVGTATAAAGAATLTANSNNDVTGDITAQTTVSLPTMRMAGNRTVTLGSGQTLTLTGAGVLATGGSSTITGGTLATGSAVLVARTNLATDTLSIGSAITGTGGLTKTGAGTLVLSGANTRTGTIEIAQGTIRLSGTGTLGGQAAVNVRQAGTLDLGGVSTGGAIGAFSMLGTITNSSATPATLTVGNANNGGTMRGVIQDGTGRVSVTKLGTSNMNFFGPSTYTGVTTIGSTALVLVDLMADIGQASGIGRGDATSDATNAASLVFNGTTGGLTYQGAIVEAGTLTLGSRSASTNRLFTLAGTGAGSGATLSSTASNGNAIVWSNSGAIAFGAGATGQTLIFTGDSTGDNTFTPQLTDNAANLTAVTKTGTGLWVLANANNTYTGATTVSEGTLAIAAAGSLPAGSPLVLGATTTSGVFQATGTFERPLAATATAGTGSVTWGGTTGSGGFAAHGDKLVVAVGGLASPTTLTWGSGGFVPTGAQLLLGSATSLAETEFRNPIDLNGAVRTISVADNGNTAGDFASLTGAIGGGAGSGLLKTGAGSLVLGGASTYTGTTAVDQGTLVVRTLGQSGSAGGTSVGDQAAGNTNAGAVILGNATTTGAILQYVGAGETSDRKIRLRGTTAGNQIHADGAGPLILTNVAHDTTETGSKTLSLRGSNTQGNTISSALTDNGAGVLSVTIDGGATWILSGSNTYTGETTSGGGALGLGSDTVFTGTLALGNGSVFAAGGNRTIATPVRLGNNVTAAVIGDHSLSFTNTFALSASANDMTLHNTLAQGAALNLGAVTADAMTASRAWTINGSGTTNISGNITTSTAFGLRVSKTGTGTLTLGGTGGSDFNKAGAVFNLDAGTLRLTAANAIPSGTGFGNLDITPELADGDVATFDLGGFSQTVNGLIATTDGTVIVRNSTASNASLTFGSADSAVNFGTGVGSYTITDAGAGVGRLSIFKAGSASATIPAAVTLTYRGTTGVTGGSLTLAAAVDGTTALSAATGTTLALTGGIVQPGAVTSVSVAGGATLSLIDGAGNLLTNLSTLTLGSTGGTNTSLNFNVGTGTTDRLGLLTGGTLSLFTGNKVTFNLTDAGLAANTSYELLSAADGGFTNGSLSAGDYLLGATPGGFTGITLTATNTSVFVTTGGLITGDIFWRGLTNTTWNGNVNNWSTDQAGTTVATTIPGAGTNVVFQSEAATSGAVTTTLEQNFKVNSLVFQASTTPANTPASVTIAPGAAATNRLEIAPQAATAGIAITAGGPPAVIISSPLKISAAQTWNVADAATTLTVSGSLFGEAAVTKTGPGLTVLSAAADSTFNPGDTASFTVSGGTLRLDNAGAIGSVANENFAAVTIGSGGLFYVNAASATTGSALTLSGGTLTAGTAAQTYSGNVAITAESTINMRDAANPVTSTTQRNITLPGTLSGTGRLVIDSIDTLTGGNPYSGTVTLSADNSGWSGGLRFVRGTVTPTNTAALGTGPITASGGRITFNTAGGTTFNLNQAITIDASGGVFEIGADASGTPTSDMTANLAGVVTLGSVANANNALRLYLNPDNFSVVNLTNSVVLANNASISVAGSTTRPATISGVISETGGGRVLSINDDQGGWAATNQILALTNANTYTGGTTLASGTLRIGHKDALGPGTLTVSGAATLDAAVSLTAGNAGVLANAITLNADLTTSGNDMTLSAAIAGTGGLAKTGPNTLTLPAANTYTGNTSVAGGTLNLTGSLTGNGTTTAGSTLSFGTATGTSVVNIGGNVTNYYSLNGPTAANAVGVYNQTGGTVNFTSTKTDNSTGLVSNSSSGFGALTITGGTTSILGRFILGRQGTGVAHVGGTGVLNLKGEWGMLMYGSANTSGSLTIGPGGLVDRTGATNRFGIFMDQAGQYGVLNVAGGSFVTTTQSVVFGNSGAANGNIGFLNLAQGSLVTGSNVVQSIGTSTGQLAYINLAGGTLRATAALTAAFPTTATGQTVTGTVFGPITNAAAVGNTTQNFAGGFTVDTNTFAVTIPTPLVAPTGFGVTQATITIPTTGNSGYVAPPLVRFSAPASGGVPASGYALVSGGQVTGIVITAPGAYAENEQPTVTLTGGGGSIAAFQTSPLTAANAGGGLVKIGTGTLSLTGDNTYAGGTTVTGGTLAIGAGGTSGSIVGGIVNNAAVIFSRSDAVVFPGVISGSGSVTKQGTGSLELSAVQTYGGATSIDAGTLTLTAAQTLTGNLQFGSADTVTTAGTLALSGADVSFGQLVVQTNSTTATPTLTIPTGRALTLTGNVRIGTNLAGSTTTLFSATGGGGLVVNNPAANGVFAVGGTTATTGQGNAATADFSGLSSLAVALDPATGVFRVNPSSTFNVTGKEAILILPDTAAATTAITANVLAVGNSAQNNDAAGGQLNELKLGRGTSTFNVNTVNIGTGNRDIGSITFQGAAGSLVLRAADGTGAVAFNMGTGAANTGIGGLGNTFDVRGHQADLKLGAVAIGTQDARASNLSNLFAFDTGTLEIGSLVASTRGANTVTTTTTIEIGGGTVTSGPWTLATNSGPGTAIATANLTGGTLTFSGGISRGAQTGAGPATGTVNLAGATLDLGGNTIGSATNSIVFTATAGALRNLSELNGGGTLAKTGSGILTLAGTNTYTGPTDIQAGEVRAGSAGGLSGSSAFAVGSATFLSLAGNAASIGGLSGAGTVRNNAAIAATLSVGGTGGTFSGVIEDGAGGGALALTKTGTGTLALSGANTYVGGTTVSAGTLSIGAGGATGSIIGDILNDATVLFDRSSDFSYAGLISGSGAVSKSGAGNLTLGGANSYAGPTTVSGGFLTVGDASALGTAAAGTTVLAGGSVTLPGGMAVASEPLSLTGDGAVASAGALRNLAGTNTWGGPITVTAGSSRITSVAGLLRLTGSVTTAGTGNFNVGGTGDIEITGPLSGPLVLFKSSGGAGTLTLSGANTYDAGVTTVANVFANGVVSVASIGSVGSTSSNLGAQTTAIGATIGIGSGTTGATLRYTGTGETTDRIVNLRGTTGSVTLDQSGTGLLKFLSNFTATGAGSKTLFLQGSTAGTGELAGAIVDNDPSNLTSITKNGTGVWTLSGLNTYSGGTAVTAGRLVATNASALGLGNVTIASGGILDLDVTPALGSSTVAMSPGGRLLVASGVSVPLAGLSSLGGWEIDPSTLGLSTVAKLLSGTVLAGGTTLSAAWTTSAPAGLSSDVLQLAGTGAGNPFVLSMTYDPATTSGTLSSLNVGRRTSGSSDAFAPIGTSFQGVGVPWTSSFTTPGQYGVDTATQTVWVVSDTNSEFAVVPEPSTIGLLAAAAAAVAGLRRAGRRQAA